jgi:hypothetical protein
VSNNAKKNLPAFSITARANNRPVNSVLWLSDRLKRDDCFVMGIVFVDRNERTRLSRWKSGYG